MTGQIGSVEVLRGDSSTRIVISGEIDLSNVTEMQERIEQVLKEDQEPILDLRPVTFMGSEGVRLIYLLSAFSEDRGTLRVLVEPDGIPAQVLKMTKMDERVDIIHDPEDVSG